MSQHLDGLNLVELLDLLEPVPQPMPISMAPQTPGWIVLAVLALKELPFEQIQQMPDRLTAL